MKHTICIPPLKNIKVKDPLFSHYVNLVADKIIPYQWEVLNDRVEGIEKSYVVHNFRVAAGEEGERLGAVFCDTDAYKWIETLAYCIESGTGKEYEKYCDSLIDLMEKAQQEDGYLNTYFSVVNPAGRWSNLAEGHELYGAGHLFEAAVAYYKATGKEKILQIAIRFADLIYKQFMEINTKGYPGHQEIELALVKLAKVTGDQKYIALSKHFIDERGKVPNYLVEELENRKNDRLFPEFSDYDAQYAQTQDIPVRQKEAVGHAVRAMYMYSAMSDLARELDDDELRQSCETLWDNVTRKRMYITGGIGSSGHLERFTSDYDLPNDRMYCESCASVGLMMFGQRMTALTGQAKYYDVVEKALCNTVIGGISMHGDKYFYVNPLEVWPQNCLDNTSMKHVKPVRQPWYAVACCPPNIARTLASLGQYIYAIDEKGIYLNQFIGSELQADIRNCSVKLEVENGLYRGSDVKIKAIKCGNASVLVRIRIPKYLKKVQIFLGKDAISPAMENGYAVIAISKEGEQIITLKGDVIPIWNSSNRLVRANTGKMALSFGPFIYCAEEEDNSPILSEIYCSSDCEIQVKETADNLPGDLPMMLVDGYRIHSQITKDLYGETDSCHEKTEVKMIPYCLWCNRTPGEMTVWIKELYHIKQ